MASAGSSTAAARKPAARDARAAPPSAYQDAVREPLYCLLFLLPIVLAYEFGALMLRPVALPDQQLIAQKLILYAFAWFGPSAVWMPGVAILLTLLAWHVLSGRSWHVRGWALPLMAVESVVLAAPLFVINDLLVQTLDGVISNELKRGVVLGLGAAIYEELVFRLGLISLLLLVFVDALRIPRKFAAAAAAVIAAVLFSACHMQPIGGEPFDTGVFVMRSVAGAYLSLLFLFRGLGVATGAHATYNTVLIVTLAMRSG